MLVVLAVLVLIVLYFKSGVDGHEYFQTVSTIRDLQRIDADWNAQILRTGLALNKNFDPLAGVLPRLRQVKQKLSKSELNKPEPALADVSRQLSYLMQLLKQKEKLVESFKSGHAVMRNSVRFLPNAEQQLLTIAREYELFDMVERMRGVLGRIYTFVLLPNEELKQNIIDLMGRLQVSDGSKDLIDTLRMFKNHAQLILDSNIENKKKMSEAVSMPTAVAADELFNLYDKFHGARLARAEDYRLALITYSSLMVVALVVIGLKLRSSYRALNDANVSLQYANDTLEQKVGERTRKLRDSQSQLVQSEKMAAIGQMVAGVAHEINTPLGYVGSNVEIIGDVLQSLEAVAVDFHRFAELMQSDDADEENIKKQMDSIHERVLALKENELFEESRSLIKDARYGLKQINEIVLNLKEFSRMDRSKEDEFDINEGLEQTLKIAYNSYKHEAEIIKEFGDVPNIRCFPSQVNQVFLNLITNAAHAVSQVDRPGIIRIATGVQGDSVYITIRDNGIGMTEDVQQRIFEPFYTTKDVGNGTGLGLSITHAIIQEHEGKIKLLSKPGVGSNFLILFPIDRHANGAQAVEKQEMIA